ncbi:hypothetical protein DFP72DRAFT_934171 [Ephemerocybe angulata]|uniref:Secreted protein n=1 Tax=Ephemerocybe angulata TaxID=980116 RepID=A0A8H6HB95_9AGAR|nr:hypothetical protein DFP72DRAFT_934171 [Tulosesus angulatus]
MARVLSLVSVVHRLCLSCLLDVECFRRSGRIREVVGRVRSFVEGHRGWRFWRSWVGDSCWCEHVVDFGVACVFVVDKSRLVQQWGLFPSSSCDGQRVSLRQVLVHVDCGFGGPSQSR